MTRVLLLVPFRSNTQRFQTGNEITAERWKTFLTELGYDVLLSSDESEGCFDIIVALHAVRCHEAIERLRLRCGPRPTAVVLTGTDLHSDDPIRLRILAESLGRAQRIVFLREVPVNELPEPQKNAAKIRCIPQSALDHSPKEPLGQPSEDLSSHFSIVQLAHLREVKQPFLIAEAVNRLPTESRAHVFHAGGELADGFDERAEAFSASVSRYSYLGAKSHRECMALLRLADLMVLFSRSEGGANVVSEALALDVPILATPTEGTLGVLGDAFPGYIPFSARDHIETIAERLWELERFPDLLLQLKNAGRERAALVTMERERARIGDLMRELEILS